MGRGGIDSLLNVSKSALFAQTQAIRVIGDNIANVNTPGYTRRKAELVALSTAGTSSLSIGTGVDVNRIVRITDRFINAQLLDRVSDRADASIRDELLSRAEAPFAVDGTGNIGFYLSEFFSALEDLAANPSDIGLRQNVLEKGSTLTTSVSETFNSLASLQREADSRIGVILRDVNRITQDLAEVNTEIQKAEISDQEALALRDQRDGLLKELSEYVSFDTVEANDGTLVVTLASGFSLVDGSGSHQLEFIPDPSFAPPGGFPTGVDGLSLGHIVYDFDPTAGQSHVDLTHVIAGGGGELAGLLKFRGTQDPGDTSPFDANGGVVELAARVEAIARDLLTRFNQAYQGPSANEPALDLNGNSPSEFGLFTFNGAADVVNDDMATMADLNAIGFANYASRIQFGVTTPEGFAAAVDQNPAAGAPVLAPGDSRNIDRLLAAREATQNYSLYGVGTLPTTTIEEMYQTTVTAAGSLSSSAKNSAISAAAREAQVEALQANVSGVSLDEEFANLINFQRAYEGSARMIRIADELMVEIINLLG